MPAHTIFKRLLIGRPLATHESSRERLTKKVALAVFSSDAVASTAFGTEVILAVLVPAAGMAALHDVVPISLVVIAMLVILVLSYRQTIYAYPSGGGSYIVSRENLGEIPALVAAASLLIDYTLNVSVSVAAGVAAITSAVVGLRGHPVSLGVGLVLLITVANLRGVRESGRLFAIPVYGYVAMMGALIIWGLARSFTGHLARMPVNHAALAQATAGHLLVGGVTLFALMRAFSSGAVALSGVEAISNGVPAFRRPEPRNAATTLVWTGLLLGTIFLGVALLTMRLAPTLSSAQTLLSLLGGAVFGHGTPLYVALQATTAGILCLSANTSFADFPRLGSVVARDGYLPHQLAHRGDRLVFSNGILALAMAASILLVAFGGTVTALVPLFAVGLFSAFTLSQAGMVMHHRRHRERGWQRGVAINGLGALTASVVLVVVVVSKFTEGAWIPTLAIPLMVLGFKSVRRHYARLAAAEAIEPGSSLPVVHTTVVIPVGPLDRATLAAVGYARSIKANRLAAVTVALDETDPDELHRAWRALGTEIPLTVVESPYRELTGPILDFLDRLQQEQPDTMMTVVLAERVSGHWWSQALHNESALALKLHLRFRPNTVIVSVPLQLS